MCILLTSFPFLLKFLSCANCFPPFCYFLSSFRYIFFFFLFGHGFSRLVASFIFWIDNSFCYQPIKLIVNIFLIAHRFLVLVFPYSYVEWHDRRSIKKLCGWVFLMYVLSSSFHCRTESVLVVFFSVPLIQEIIQYICISLDTQ